MDRKSKDPKETKKPKSAGNNSLINQNKKLALALEDSKGDKKKSYNY